MNSKFHEPTNDVSRSNPRRRSLKILGLGLAGVALVAGSLCVTGFGQKSYRLGGAWVGGREGFLWSAVQSPMDPAGLTCATRPILKSFGPDFAGLLGFFEADNLSDAVGEARMISQDTAQWTLLAHMQATPHEPGQLLKTMAIIVFSGTWRYTSADTAVLKYKVDIYLPSADADGDGFPDANAAPFASFPEFVDTARRVPIL